jgi:hypothetical protein
MLLLILLAVAACSEEVKLVRLDTDAATPVSAPYVRPLVLAVATTEAQRISLENTIVDELSDRGIDAVPGYTLTGKSTVLLQENINAAVVESSADSILLAHITGARSTAEVVPGRVDMKSTCRGGNPVDLFLYEHEELSEPGTISVGYEVVILSSLYDVASESRVWMVQSTCSKKAELDEVIADEARAIARQLVRDRMVQASGRR